MSGTTVVTKTNFVENYNSVVEDLAKSAFEKVLEHFANVVDENQNKLHFNYADICNVLTNVAQQARAADAAKTA